MKNDESTELHEGDEAPPPGTRAAAAVRWIIIALSALIAFGAVASHCGLIQCGGSTAKRALYHCPMHPSVIQESPGDCPICGMSLVPVEGPSEAKSAAQDDAPPPETGAGLEPGHEQHRHEPNDAWYCPMHPLETWPDATGRCPICKMKVSHRELGAPPPQWLVTLPKGHEGHHHNPNDPTYCPQHPLETFPMPGAPCPICGGEPAIRDPARAAPLPKAELAPASPTRPTGLVPIELSNERIQLAGLKMARAERDTVTSKIEASGLLTPDEERLAKVQLRASGWLEKLYVTKTGEQVRAGQPLAALYSPELFAAQQEYLRARAAPRDELLASAARAKLELLGVAPSELERIEQRGSAERALLLRAPVSGVVLQKNAVEGSYVEPGTELFQLADLRRVWLLADVPEREAGRVVEGARTTLELAAWPGEQFVGKVDFLYPTLETKTRSLKARILFANPAGRLKPGMFGRVRIDAPSAEGLFIPRAAAIDDGKEQYLFVARGGGRFEPRLVKLGARFEERIMVLEGLKEGEEVVASGNFFIDSESRLRAAVEAMEPQHKSGASDGQHHH